MYEDVTYEALLNRMLARIPDKADKREGSLIWDTHASTAAELQLLYKELDNILQEVYGHTASRDFLILRCKERGIYPRKATKAVLKGIFSPADIDVTGHRFNKDSVNYVVVKKISEGIYQVQCETAGKLGNQFLGSVTPIEYIYGLQHAELTEILIPGEAEEGTEELRQRYFHSFEEAAFGGNVRDYLEKADTIPGVGSIKVTRVWNGEVPLADLIPSDNVKVWYEGIKDTLSAEVKGWLDTVYGASKEEKLTVGGTVLLTIINSEFDVASDELVHRVQEVIDPQQYAGEGYGLAPVGHVVMVRSAKAVPIDIKTTLSFEAGYSWENLQKQIDEVISEYLLELRKAWDKSSCLTIRLSQIDTRLLGVDGVVDVRDTLMNGLRSNLILKEYEIPILGGVGV